jgi:uncharacterized protein YjbI with pentapeptide repeats
VAEFVCGAWEKNPNDLSACKNLPEYRDTGYCVLHFPGEEKREDFEQVKKDKLEQEDYDFRGAIFTEGTSDFRRCVFDGNADFIGATFVGKADFTEAQFSGKRTYFSRAQFSAAETSFSDAQFGCAETSFQAATFAKEVDFTGVTFGEKITFWETKGIPYSVLGHGFSSTAPG